MSRPSGPRIRSFKPERYHDERLFAVSRDARHLYDGLTVRADDDGRGTANPSLVKANVMPADNDATPERIEGWLRELHDAGLLVVYEVDERALYAIVSWDDDQRVDKRTPSKLPAPPADVSRNSSREIANAPESSEQPRDTSAGTNAQPRGYAIPDADPTRRADTLDPRHTAKSGVLPDSSRGIANARASRADHDRDLDQDQDQEKTPSSSPDGAEHEKRADVTHLCHLLADLMFANDPGAKATPDSRRWRDAMRLLLDRDGRAPDLVEQVIRWSQADDFWRTNILSPSKLREKFAQLLLRMQANTNGHQPAAAPDFSKYDTAARAAA